MDRRLVQQYNFVGAIDEVSISKVARSADWIKLQYENQKPLHTLVGPVVQPGDRFAVSQSAITILEGKQATVTAEAGGAQKIYWMLKARWPGIRRRGGPPLVSPSMPVGSSVTNRSPCNSRRSMPNAVKTKDIPITIKENIPEPIFTLKAPAKWNGRETIEIVPQITNAGEMTAKGADD